MTDPYEKCPVYENETYLLRLVEAADAPDLLLVYSDKQAVPLFNSDNCNGDDFHYTTLERMQKAIEFWLWEYGRKGFVRWTIIDKTIQQAVGTIELFNRKSEDYFNDCGLLRLDLRSDHEEEAVISEILSLILAPAFELFDCQMIATKVPPLARARKSALTKYGFTDSEQKLMGGHDHKCYGDYSVLQKPSSPEV